MLDQSVSSPGPSEDVTNPAYTSRVMVPRKDLLGTPLVSPESYLVVPSNVLDLVAAE